jgi:lipopolysaccharide transport system permease protein
MSIDTLLDTPALASPHDAPGARSEHAPRDHPRQPRTVAPAAYVIEPPRGWQPINLRELWRFRELICFLVWRDVKVRYKQTLLGAAWALLQPAMLMIVFTIFLGRIAKIPSGDVPYPLFVYLGVLPWSFFSTAISNAGNSVVGSERLVTKVYFPRLAIPIAAVGAAVVDFVIALGLLVGMMLYYGIAPGAGMLLIPVIFALLALTALGVGTMLAALNVLYRDFRYVIPFMVQVWMFATPSVYMAAQPQHAGIRLLMQVNPVTGLIAAFRSACLGHPIAVGPLLVSAGVALAACVLGCGYFRRLEQRFADII